MQESVSPVESCHGVALRHENRTSNHAGQAMFQVSSSCTVSCQRVLWHRHSLGTGMGTLRSLSPGTFVAQAQRRCSGIRSKDDLGRWHSEVAIACWPANASLLQDSRERQLWKMRRLTDSAMQRRNESVNATSCYTLPHARQAPAVAGLANLLRTLTASGSSKSIGDAWTRTTYPACSFAPKVC